jgi:hypothetical protein
MRTILSLALGLAICACTGADAGSTGAAAGGGAGGSVGSGGAPRASDGAVASSGGSTGATDGSAHDASIDAPPFDDASESVDVMATLDAPERDADAPDGPGGTTLPGRPWNYICEKSWTHEQCCAFLCTCLKEECADSPKDAPGIASCMTTCPKLSDMTLRCHVFHCYEAVNPNNPKDYMSHCGHASGRVAGGNCPEGVYQ